MRHSASVLSISWIPSEAINGAPRLAFDRGFTHYDEPPPEQVDDLAALQAADRFRFANRLSAWIEVDQGGRITDCGYDGGGLVATTSVRLGPLRHTFQPTALPELRAEPEVGAEAVRFVQTGGGHTGLPAPRRVRRRPYVQWQAPLVWTTLALTLRADGSHEGAMVGASRFPRHWVYDGTGRLVAKSGLADFTDWWRRSFGRHTPWGDQDSPAFVTAVESALERTLSAEVMRGGGRPKVRRLKAGTTLVRQGEPGNDVFLVLDGVVRVDHDGEPLAEYGPGALLGERSGLEAGTRTSTLVAVTPCTVAVVGADRLDRGALDELATGHRRELAPGS